MKVTGYGIGVSLQKEYEQDPYFAKGLELDEFFTDQCIANSMKWGLGGSVSKPISRDAIEGYDDKGADGKWKRLIKWSYKKNKETNERIYQDYPPRMEFGVPTSSMKEELGSDNLLHTHATFRPKFFDANGDTISNVTSDNIDEVLPKWSRVV